MCRNWLDDGYNLDKIDHSHKRGTAEHRYYAWAPDVTDELTCDKVHQAEKLLGTKGETKIDSFVVADEQSCMERCAWVLKRLSEWTEVIRTAY